MLNFLYTTIPGRLMLKGLTNPKLSDICGRFMDSSFSKFLIPIFVRKNNINLSEYHSDNFTCFNDCFSRKVKKDMRPICKDPKALMSPCDGLLSVYHINGRTVLPVKQSRYTLLRLLRSRKLAEEFSDGLCLVFRLCVDNYHRYCYFDDGIKGENHFIDGVLHTVRPIALENGPVFTENCREFTVMKTRHFGKAIQMEVGAMLVGKIQNNHGKHRFKRGEEKGCFLYGGSTIILLLKKDSAVINESIEKASQSGFETRVRMGQRIGKSII